MTHEFRTPLSSIISLSRLLLDRLDGELTTEQEKQVQYIRKSAETLHELVNDLLDLAKVDAGKVTMKIDRLDAEEFIGGLRGVFRPLLINRTDLEVIFHSDLCDVHIETDEGKLAQILRNLVSNALKYTEQGTVEVRCYSEGEESVVFDVIDTGMGIASENLETIFQEFSQIDSPLQSRSKGTGLGLPLSRRLAQLLGGELTVESTLGVGSTFRLRIPRMYAGLDEGTLISANESHTTGKTN